MSGVTLVIEYLLIFFAQKALFKLIIKQIYTILIELEVLINKIYYNLFTIITMMTK